MHVNEFAPVVKPAPPPTEKLTAEEKTLLDEFNKLPADVRKAFLKTFKAINAELDRDKIRADE